MPTPVPRVAISTAVALRGTRRLYRALCVATLGASTALGPSSLGAQDTTVAPTASRRVILPVLGYAEQTGLQLGATVFRFFRMAGAPGTHPSSDAIYIARALDGYTKAFVQSERWSAANTRRALVRVAYLSYPLPFFGMGPDSPGSAEEWYNNGVTTLQLFLQPALRPGDYAIAGYRLTHTRMRELEPDGALATGVVTGATGGVVSQVQLGIARDTRDHLTAPVAGTYARLTASVASRALGSEFGARRLTLDARQYRALAGRQVLAGQVQIDGVAGHVPFDQLPMIGADTAVRGYERGRYRDRHALTTQLEFRTAHWRRLGCAVFVGAGVVAGQVGDLASNRWYPSAGVGARILLVPRERAVARLDVGFGRGSVSASIGLGEAF